MSNDTRTIGDLRLTLRSLRDALSALGLTSATAIDVDDAITALGSIDRSYPEPPVFDGSRYDALATLRATRDELEGIALGERDRRRALDMRFALLSISRAVVYAVVAIAEIDAEGEQLRMAA